MKTIQVKLSLISKQEYLCPAREYPVYPYKNTPLPGLCKALSLNPKLLRAELDACGIPTVGHWPDVPSREGAELVSYKELAKVIDNCPDYAVWSFFGTMDVKLVNSSLPGCLARAVIPKGTVCTLFNDWEGGGSLNKMETIRDIPLTELRKRQKRYDDKVSIMIEEDSEPFYSSYQVYNRWLSEKPLFEIPAKEKTSSSRKRYSVFFKNGDETNYAYMDRNHAMKLAEDLEEDGYEVIVAKLLPNGGWQTVYETI